jgi:hypothetical protein
VVLAVPALAVPVASAAGCAGSSKPAGLTRANLDAAAQARARAATAETALIAQYDAALALPTVSGDQVLAARLTGVRAEHAAHLAALHEGGSTASGDAGGSGTAGSGASPSASSGSSSDASPSQPSTSASASPGAMPSSSASSTPPMDAKTAVAGLVKAEQDAASRLTSDVLAMDGPTALLLASISASESGHAALLLGGTS